MPVAPPRPKGPPLNALRAFEAAARLGSFAAAAEEISVTPGAVSQQIKVIEDWAGVPLFQRRARGVRLAPAGEKLRPHLTEAFDRISAATRTLRELRPRPALNIAALPSVAQLWLQPRLERIRRRLPGTSISVYALETAPDLRRNIFDLSLFIREPRRGGEIVLQEDELFPVCTPEIAARLRSGGSLAQEVLLRDETWSDDWEKWAAQAGVELPAAAGSPRYSLYSMAVADAKAGAGVLIGHGCLIADALRDGVLVRPFPQTARSGKALVLEVAEVDDPPAAVQTLCRFLRDEAA